MSEVEKKMKNEKVKRFFRCKVNKCRKKEEFYVDTIFKKSKMGPKDVFYLSYFWPTDEAKQYKQVKREISRELGTSIAPNTYVEWMLFFKEVTVEYFERHPIVLGGPGKVVELDETVLTRRKYNVGRCVDEQWIFGGVEKGIHKMLLGSSRTEKCGNPSAINPEICCGR